MIVVVVHRIDGREHEDRQGAVRRDGITPLREVGPVSVHRHHVQAVDGSDAGLRIVAADHVLTVAALVRPERNRTPCFSNRADITRVIPRVSAR